MSFYNSLFGVNQATFFILPLLELGHPERLPRFRDCFVNNENGQPEIHVYTRVGGGNRDADFGEDVFYKHPNYITTFDDDFDSTYGTYTFSIPEKWKADFELIMSGKIPETSDEYKKLVINTFPKAEEKLAQIFSVETN